MLHRPHVSSLAQGKESLHMVAEHKTPTVDASHDGPDAVPRSGRTKCKGKGKGKEEGKGYGKGKGKTMKGTGRKGAGKSGRFKGGRGRTERSRIPRAMLVVWQDRTQVVGMSMES